MTSTVTKQRFVSLRSSRANPLARGAMSPRWALCLGVLASSLLAACSSSDATGGASTAGATASAGASAANGGRSNVAGASAAPGGAPAGGAPAGGAPAGGDPGVAGSSVGGSSGGSGAGTGGANSGTGGASGGRNGAAGASGGGGPAGCPTGATFCDNFDAASTLGTAWTTDNTLNATIKVVSAFTTTPGPTAAHSGANAVQVSFTTGAGYGMIVSKMGFPAAPSATGYWARVWLYVETPATDTGHDVYIEGSTGTNLSNNGARPLNTQSGKMSINIDPVGSSEASAASTMAIPRSAWTCFEWQISATGGNGDVSLYVGGATAATASIKAKAIQALTEQRIGYERYASGVAGNLWIDDYAIGTARLGCTP